MMKNSKSRAKAKRARGLAEKLSKIMYFIQINFGVPSVILPNLIVSYSNYFSTDAGSAAFELPLPSW